MGHLFGKFLPATGHRRGVGAGSQGHGRKHVPRDPLYGRRVDVEVESTWEARVLVAEWFETSLRGYNKMSEKIAQVRELQQLLGSVHESELTSVK